MYTEAFAGAAPEQAGVHRTCTAADDALLLLVPVEDAFGAGVALDHALVVVAGVVGQRFDGDEVTRVDFDLRLQRFREIAPVHGVGAGGDVIVVACLHRAIGLARHRLADPAGAQRAEPRRQRTLEQTAPRRIGWRWRAQFGLAVAVHLHRQAAVRIAEAAVLVRGMGAGRHGAFSFWSVGM
ncbi:MAG: hypothetical protein NVV69_19115 [Methyloversatilis sp.]|uniref:hypothetical protein n=1 Tax=Methyloversatilis sp. TaxID=2569862 RepID=UPI0025F10340|nr:hypothetical protein [Methyloversatilis sp.]MCR6668071.1 hypothetical protein [Methyloversatilis sp.]